MSAPLVPCYCWRLASHAPVVTPAPKPKAKKAILAAEDTSDHMNMEVLTARSKNKIDKAIRKFFDFIIKNTPLVVGLATLAALCHRNWEEHSSK